MNSFKEWLSDYLRYFILALAVLLAVGAIVLGVKLYQQNQSAQEAQAQADPDNIVIKEETKSGEETEPPEKETKEDKKETEKDTEKETEKDTGKTTEEQQTEQPKGVNAKPETDEAETGEESAGTKQPETKTSETKQPETKTSETKQPETKIQPIEKPDTKQPETKQPENDTLPENSSGQNSAAVQVQTEKKEPPKIIPIQTEAPQTEPPQTEPPETDPPETDPPEPVYLTLNGACNFRSYPDYGDNIITYYSEGTVVEFLEDVGGWYKVQIDGMVGYMGARFFN